jgi:hypothetical protein
LRTLSDAALAELSHDSAMVLTEDVADILPVARGVATCGLPYASRLISVSDSGCAGCAAVGDTVNVLIDAHGNAGTTLKSNGAPKTLLDSFALAALNVFVPSTARE